MQSPDMKSSAKDSELRGEAGPAPEMISDSSTDESDAELLPAGQSCPSRKVLHCSARVAIATTLALAACAAVALAAIRHTSTAQELSAPRTAPDITVRALLESPEVTDAVTDNFISLSEGLLGSRDEVRAAVADNFANISRLLNQRKEHDLDLCQLSKSEKDSALSMLRHFADPRIRRLSDSIAEAVEQTASEGGDRASLQRRLKETLPPHIKEMRQLCTEVSPAAKKACAKFDLGDVNELDTIRDFDADQWHFSMKMSKVTKFPAVRRRGGRRDLLSRRLSSSVPGSALLSSTYGQVGTLLGFVEGTTAANARMAAPARKLFFEAQKAYEVNTTGWQRLEACATDNMGKGRGGFTPFLQCIAKNCVRLWSWLSAKFMALTGHTLTVPGASATP